MSPYFLNTNCIKYFLANKDREIMTTKNNLLLVVILATLILTVFSSCGHSRKTTKSKTTNASKPKVAVRETSKPAPLTGFADTVTVSKAQLLLNLFGYSPGKADGTMKEQTAVAITNFQADQQLPNGDRSDTTLNALGVPLFDFTIDSLQKILSKKGYDPGPIDGLVGPMTRGAIREFMVGNNFPTNKLTKESREALFSIGYQYDKQPEDLLQYDTADKNPPHPAFNAAEIDINKVQIIDIRRALEARGFHTGELINEITSPLQDALFLYQTKNKLPIGDFNTETLRALGFR